MDTKLVITELKQEQKVLEERLGNVRLALRGLGAESSSEGAVGTQVRTRKRVHITNEMREKYNAELIAVLEAFGACTVNQFHERGSFEEISRTAIYRLALNHPRIVNETNGKSLVFKLR